RFKPADQSSLADGAYPETASARDTAALLHEPGKLRRTTRFIERLQQLDESDHIPVASRRVGLPFEYSNRRIDGCVLEKTLHRRCDYRDDAKVVHEELLQRRPIPDVQPTARRYKDQPAAKLQERG